MLPSVLAPPDLSHVYFRCDWPEPERSLIDAAVEQADVFPAPPQHALGKEWVCLRIRVGADAVFVAHRLGEHTVLEAESAEQLATRIASR